MVSVPGIFSILISVSFILVSFSIAQPDLPPPTGYIHRFEYKYSFKPPLLAKRDGQVPFWEFGGHAIPSDDYVRLTPSLKNKRGWIWTRNQTNFEWWSIDLTFRITGRGKVGADGIALWITEEKGMEGPVYGNTDLWKGLAIFMDTYDNDQKHNNPAVIAIVNDGSRAYSHDNDGEGQIGAHCVRDYRNRVYPVRLRVTYQERTVRAYITQGLAPDDFFEPCFELPNVDLPRQTFFGLSAATGALADDHDVQSVITHSIVQPNAPKPEEADADKLKYEREFKDFEDKLKKTREEYQKKKGVTSGPEGDEVEVGEDQSDRAIRQLLSGQAHLANQLKLLQAAVETTRDAAAGVAAHAGTGTITGTGTGAGPAAPADLARRADLSLLSAELSTSLSQLKSTLDRLGERHDPAEAVSRLQEQLVSLTKEFSSLNFLIREGRTAQQPQQQNCNCATSCVSSFTLMVIMAFQIAIYIGYSMYKHQREMTAKKLY